MKGVHSGARRAAAIAVAVTLTGAGNSFGAPKIEGRVVWSVDTGG